MSEYTSGAGDRLIDPIGVHGRKSRLARQVPIAQTMDRISLPIDAPIGPELLVVADRSWPAEQVLSNTDRNSFSLLAVIDSRESEVGLDVDEEVRLCLLSLLLPQLISFKSFLFIDKLAFLLLCTDNFIVEHGRCVN